MVGEQPSEQEVLRRLHELAEAAELYCELLEECQTVVKRLSEDFMPAALLHQSMVVGLATPAQLGTPRQLERLAAEVLRGLQT